MTKDTPGEHFQDLDLLSKFMVNPPASKTLSKAGIQEIDSVVTPEGDTKYNWFLAPLEAPEDDETECPEVTLQKHSYGFALSKNGLFKDKVCLKLALLSYPI